MLHFAASGRRRPNENPDSFLQPAVSLGKSGGNTLVFSVTCFVVERIREPLSISLYLLLEQLFADYDFMIFNRFLYTVCFLLNIILAIVLFFASFRCLFLLKRQVVNQDMRYLLLQILFAFGINIFQLFGLFSLLPRL